MENAIFSSDIIGSTTFIKIISEEKTHQENKQVVENRSDTSLYFIKLPPRVKKIQRNMQVRNASGDELLLVPSYIVHSTLIQICKNYKDKLKRFKNGKIEQIKKLNEELESLEFSKIFCYEKEYNKEEYDSKIDSALSCLKDVEPFLGEEPEYRSVARKLYYLLRIYKRSYLPIVKLDEELEKNFCVLILYSIESITRRKDKVSIKSHFGGETTLDIPLEVEKEMSNHLKIEPPNKSSLVDVKIENICTENKSLKDKIKNVSVYYDSDMLYMIFTPEESTVIWNNMKSKSSSNEEEPTMKVKVSIIRKKPAHLLLPNLTSLAVMTIALYISVLITPFSAILFGYVPISLSKISLSITTVIAMAIMYHTYNQKFLSGYSKIHIFIVLIIWVLIGISILILE